MTSTRSPSCPREGTIDPDKTTIKKYTINYITQIIYIKLAGFWGFGVLGFRVRVRVRVTVRVRVRV